MFQINDSSVYSKAVDDFSDMIFRIAYQSLYNKSDAEDVVQEVFLTLLKNKDKAFTDKEHFKSWLIRVSVNKCKDIRKSAFSKNTVPLDKDFPYTQEEKFLLDEIRKLPKDYGSIIYLHYYEGYTVKEIANILGKNQNTINSKLQRGRKKLKEQLLKGDIL